VGFLEWSCDENASRKWLFIGGAGDKVGALYSRVGAAPRCPLWLKLLSPFFA